MGWQAWKSGCAALVVGIAASQAAFAAPTFTLAGPLPPVNAGSGILVQVLASDFTDLYGYQFSLSFNSAVLSATSVSEGSFLSGAGTTVFSGGTINNTAGTISFVFDSVIGPGPGVNGAGPIATIAFNALAGGSSVVSLSNVLAQNSAGDLISVSFAPITVSVVPEPGIWAMFGAGLAGVMLVRRRQMSAQA